VAHKYSVRNTEKKRNLPVITASCCATSTERSSCSDATGGGAAAADDVAATWRLKREKESWRGE
jgi:hypothetical protein